MSSTNPEHNLTPGESDDLDRLEGTAQQRLGSYLQVGQAFAEIRDRHLYRVSHPSFDAYLRERWGLSSATVDPLVQTAVRADASVTPTPTPTTPAREARAALPHKPCEALAKACEQTLSMLGGEERLGIEIRLTVRKPGDPPAPEEAQRLGLPEIEGSMGDELVPKVRWLMTQASGTMGEVAYELESRAVDIDDVARKQLRDDILVLEGELALVKALLIERHDWDSEFRRLLRDELPPFDTDTDSEDEE